MTDEIWRAIPGFGDHYEASNMGRIRAKERVVTKRCRWGGVVSQHYSARLLAPTLDGEYYRVHVGVLGRKYCVAVHTMVLLAFVGPRPPGMEACHNNGTSTDNRSDNLRWDTHLANNRDRKAHGRYATGQDHPMSKTSLARRAARGTP